ncbi:hypothetical protein BGZ83_009714 [Gryganskiella cystojenkinii]|nr:hypothetical protein BGZ83_009714 [Gryganskiella cystojenkinii]
MPRSTGSGLRKRLPPRSISLSSSSMSSNMTDLFRRQSSSTSTISTASTTTASTPGASTTPPRSFVHLSSDPTTTSGPRQIGLGSFLLWLRDHPSSKNVGSENLARFLLVKSVSLMAACLGCLYSLVFDRHLYISACSFLLFFLPAVQGATGATKICGLILSLALASVFLSFQTRDLPLVGPSLETTLLVGLPLMTGMLVGRKVGLATCLIVMCYSIEEYRSKISNTVLSEEEAAQLWAGFGAYWISLFFMGSMTCLYQWCVEVCVREANLFKDLAVANAKSKDGVVSSVSHELRTPLAALIGWTELLMSDQTLSASAQSTVSMLHSSTLSLLTILNALLDVSKVSAAKMTNCSQNFNLHDLVLETVRMMTGLSGTRTVELLVDFSAEVPELVRADSGIIKQVLGNLISNAIKFTDVGYVNVGVSLKDEDDDTVTVEFIVQDTGRGIADGQKDKLFVEFSQVEGGKCKNHEAGTGLGLFLVKNLVEVMDGDVFVESKLGVGSTFGFVIKLEKQYLAFRTPGYDHVVTVSSAFTGGIENAAPNTPILPVTPGLARSTTPLIVPDVMNSVRVTPRSTPVSTPKDQARGGDYFTLQPSEVTRANANNITLRTRDNAFLSNRRYYIHSQCGYFEDFLWNMTSGRWSALGVRRVTYEECVHGLASESFGSDAPLAHFGDVFLIDLSPTTNRPKSTVVLTDQEHCRLFLIKLSHHLIDRAKARIGTARQASIVLFYPFGHPPSLAQEPLSTLAHYYQISLCRKPVSERALGAIIKRQVVTIQEDVPEAASPTTSTPRTSLGSNPSSTSQETRLLNSSTECLARETEKKSSSANATLIAGHSSEQSDGSTGSSSSFSFRQALDESDANNSSIEDLHERPFTLNPPQASHVRFARRNGTIPRLGLKGDKTDKAVKSSTPSSLSTSSTATPSPATVDKPSRGLLKRLSADRPGLTSKVSIQDLNATGKRVLIVDDNSFNRNLLYCQLTKLGVSRVDQAGSGQEAVDQFLPGTHALVLMDLKMPTMGGMRAVTLIREKELAHYGPAAFPITTTTTATDNNTNNRSSNGSSSHQSGSASASNNNKSLSHLLSMMDSSCPWSPERFAGPTEITSRRSSGSSVKKELRSSSGVQPATIIAVTADYGAEVGEDRKQALDKGFDDVMVKPLSLPSLSLLLERYMDYRD